MSIAKLNDVNLNYLQLQQEIGAEEVICLADNTVKDLVMVHGMATSLAFWYQSAQELSHSYRVTLFDLRGHGRSSMPNTGYTPQQIAEDLKELMDLLGIKTSHLVGHSFGGSVVLHFACFYPEMVESIILADGRLKLLQPEQKPQNWLHWQQLQPALAAVGIHLDEDESEAGYRILTEIARLQVSRTPGELDLPPSLSQVLPQIGNKRTAERWLKLIATTTAWDDFLGQESITIEALKHLSKPTLAIYGEYSPTLPTAKGLQKIWSHAKFELVPEAGHFFPLSRPQQFLTKIQQFLTSVSGQI